MQKQYDQKDVFFNIAWSLVKKIDALLKLKISSDDLRQHKN